MWLCLQASSSVVVPTQHHCRSRHLVTSFFMPTFVACTLFNLLQADGWVETQLQYLTTLYLRMVQLELDRYSRVVDFAEDSFTSLKGLVVPEKSAEGPVALPTLPVFEGSGADAKGGKGKKDAKGGKPAKGKDDKKGKAPKGKGAEEEVETDALGEAISTALEGPLGE